MTIDLPAPRPACAPHRLLHAALVALCAFAALPATAATFTVTSNADSGANTLRAAITAANNAAGADTINFNLAAGQRTISLVTVLPVITDQVDVNGTSQPGFVGVPLVRIDGLALVGSASALSIDTNSSTVRGLMITRVPGAGLDIRGLGNQVHTSYFGTDGTTALGNGTGIYLSNGSLNTIGGAQSGRHNVISGNVDNGVFVHDTANFNQFFNNRIGTNAAGTAAIPNGYAGIRTFGSNNAFGGSAAFNGNLISGNGRFGMDIGGGTGNSVRGNRVGTDVTGMLALGNDSVGVSDAGQDTVIGGALAGEGNVVSGNGDDGVDVSGTAATVLGNRIGTNATGTAALANGYANIRVFGSQHIIGAPGAGNVLSGSGRFGIDIGSSADTITVQANRIGTDPTGMLALPNADTGISSSGDNVLIGGAGAGEGNQISGNAREALTIGGANTQVLGNLIGVNASGNGALGNDGIAIRSFGVGTGTVIGAPGAGNVIADNGRGIEHEGLPATIQANIVGLGANQATYLPNSDSSAISIYGDGSLIGGSGAGEGNVLAGVYSLVLSDANANRVEGNFIGINAAQTQTFSSGYAGVHIRGDGNTIGGVAAGAGNTIRGASAFGVYVALGSANAILGNSLSGNGLAGIELDPIGPDANDIGDVDHDRNEGQNRPVLTLATAAGGNVALLGMLQSRPNGSYRIEFFHSATCHVSGLGEGQHFLGATTVTLDANGSGAIAHSLANPHGGGVITATATDADGNTSEFAPCIAIGAASAGTFGFWRDPYLAYEDIPTVRIHVLRSGGLTGAASVRLRTQDDSAAAPADYAAFDAVLQFGDGEWIRTVDVPVVLDDVPEGNESFRVQLLDATGGATVGSGEAQVLLFDHEDAWPFLSIGNLSVDEPASGQAMATFVIHLSPTDHAVDIGYETIDGSATAGADYVASSGIVTFQPGTLAIPVQVPVLADAQGEGDETFLLRLIGQGDDFIAYISESEATIVDEDDADAVFGDGFE